jgi:F-type H+-transporting ATPase subunit b
MAETTSAHTEVPSGGHGQFPPFRRDTIASQLFWFVITFVALYVMVAKLGLPRIGSILEARHGRIAADLAAANRLKEGADAAMAAYEKALAEARTRAQLIASETRDKLNAETEKTRKALEQRLNAKQIEAEKTIAATKTKALESVRGIALDAAATIVARLTGVSPAEAAVADAVDNVLKH